MNTDMSDDAQAYAGALVDPRDRPELYEGIVLGFQECQRRALALIAEEQKHKAKLYDMLKKAQAGLRVAYAAGWEGCTTYAGDQGWRDPLVDPDEARDRACREYLEKNK